MKKTLKIGMAQIASVFLNKEKTLEKIGHFIEKAAAESCELIIFPEATLPGYPFWLMLTDGALFNSDIQKEIFAHYAQQAVQIENGDLDIICAKAAQLNIAIYLGVVERPADRGGHSLYCSLVYIDRSGVIKSVHRKLQPTYEERLVWSPGDGHGLQVHVMGEFNVGGLNCWENWMPLSRTALYAQGENVHVAVWPGCERNTTNITRFIAEESRSYVISVSGIMRKDDIRSNMPHHKIMRGAAPDIIANGGSCVANPDGTWLIPPQIDIEDLIVAELDLNFILKERQNFDIAGHYSRPDVTHLRVNRDRQRLVD